MRIFIILFLLNLLLLNAQTFQVEDIIIGDPKIHYLDPEFIDVNGEYKALFYIPNNQKISSMWVGELNPANGKFISKNGLEIFVDDTLPSIFSTLINGAEWGVGKDGLSILYTKKDENGILQVWRAQVKNKPILTKLTNDSIDNIHWAATLNPNDESIIFFIARVNSDGNKTLYYTDENNISYGKPLEGFDWSSNGSRFIPGTKLFVYPKETSANKYELAEVNMTTGVERIVTNDNVRKLDVWGFKAPEYDNEILYCALISSETIGIYRFLKQTDTYATLIDSIKAPQGHPLKYLRSIEILQTGEGLFDKTYFAFLGSKNPTTLTPSDGAMWVASLGQDTEGRFVRRVDIGAVTSDSSYRVEPELLIGGDEVFLYYNAYNFDNTMELRRCRTGIKINENQEKPTKVDWFKFSKDYFPGTYDENNKYLGGTDLMYLVNHKGKLWAGTSVWNDNPGSDPTPGPQIIYKERSSSKWKVDTSMGSGYLRTDAFYSFIFTEDKFGNPLPQPDTLLMASFSDLTEPYEVCVWVRDDKNKTWIKTVVYPKVNSAENSYIRHMNLYEDKVTGIQHIFAAGVSAVVRGAYNPSLPGKLEWQGIEITGPQRMLSSAVCNGDYYIAFATDGNPTNNYGGLFRRNDGANPTWTSVWEWADTGNTDLGKNCRGLTAVNDPKGGSHQVMVGVIENLRSSYQIDPVNNTQKIEVDWQKFFEDEWGKQITAFNYAAYNNMVEIISPDKGDTCLIAGAWVTYPAAYGTPERNNSWYLVRRPNGIWHYGQVIDSLNIIPSGNGLAATRTIIKSPFTDEPNTYYFGGKDAGGTNPIFHNTAWIYKGVLRKGTTDISEESYEPKRGILISPNPASDYIEINLDKVILSEAKNPLKIYNTLGECVIEMQDVRHLRDVGHLNRINISHLPAGLYFIQFGNYSQKFMVVR